MIIKNDFITNLFKIEGITIFPFIIIKNNTHDKFITHELIHLKQQKELFVIPFFIIYFLSFFVNIIRFRNLIKAYCNIMFEAEAYLNQHNKNYLKTRKKYAWREYV